MIEFRNAKHTAREADIIEVWQLGPEQSERMVAAIYPTDIGIRIMSKHFKSIEREGYDNIGCINVAFNKPPKSHLKQSKT